MCRLAHTIDVIGPWPHFDFDGGLSLAYLCNFANLGKAKRRWRECLFLIVRPREEMVDISQGPAQVLGDCTE